jgi:preflagellin peptidase FlaK
VEQLLDLARRAIVLATLLAAGVSDYKTREVDDKIWLAGGLAAAPLLLYLHIRGFYALELHLLSLLLALLVALLTQLARLAGEADAIALAFIGLFEPPTRMTLPCLIPPASAVIAAGVLALLYTLWNAAENIRRGALEALRGQSLPTKVAALLTMRYVTAEEYVAKQHMYIPSSGARGEPLLRVAVKPAENIPPAERFWASVLLPYVSLLAAGLLVYDLLCLLAG